jgi:hypothetical protein
MKLKMTYFDFDECEIGLRIPANIMRENRWGNVPEGIEVDLSKVTDNADLGISVKERALLQKVLDWRGLDGDEITDPLRSEIMEAVKE